MKLNINFLQTGGVPLTNDLMDNIQEQIKFYDFLGDLAGNFTIIKGCEIFGSSAKAGVVAINGECYYFEGGLITSTVYIHSESISKTFEDQTDKSLIERKTVRFGTSSPQNTFAWDSFVRLDSLKEIQSKFNNFEERLIKVEQKTAPIINGGIVMVWRKPISEIPAGWKECSDLRGKTIVGLDPYDPDFKTLGANIGEKEHQLTQAELPEWMQ